MRNYLRHNGWHFTKAMCEFAVGLMRGTDDKAITPWSREEVDKLLADNKITLNHNALYDHVFVANMCKADYFKGSIADTIGVAKYIKETIDDPDGYDGLPFTRWYADMRAKRIPIDWEEML